MSEQFEGVRYDDGRAVVGARKLRADAIARDRDRASANAHPSLRAMRRSDAGALRYFRKLAPVPIATDPDAVEQARLTYARMQALPWAWLADNVPDVCRDLQREYSIARETLASARAAARLGVEIA